MKIKGFPYTLIGITGMFLAIYLFWQLDHSQDYQEHQLTYTAVWLTFASLMFIPRDKLRQQNIFIWLGPVFFIISLSIWQLLRQAAHFLGAYAVNWLTLPAMLVYMIMLFRQTAKSSKPSLNREPYDRLKSITAAENYFKLGQFQKAIDEYTIGIDQDSKDAQMYYLRSQTYEKIDLKDLAAKDRTIANELGCKPELNTT